MGYRHYICKISKKKLEQIQKSTYKELAQKYGEYDYINPTDSYCGVYNIFGKEGNIILELGKRSEIASNLTNPNVFEGELLERFGESGSTILSGNDLLKIVSNYHEMVVDYYKTLLVNDGEYKAFLENRIRQWEWKLQTPYNIDKNTKFIVNARDYEYKIFDLIREYKLFDEQKDTLILYGR